MSEKKKAVLKFFKNELFFEGGNNLDNQDNFILNFALIFLDKLIVSYATPRFKNMIFCPLSKQLGCLVDDTKKLKSPK